MHDEAALRRLVSRLRQDLLKLPEELEYFAKVKRETPPGHDDFDPDDFQAAEYRATYAIENAVHLVGALLMSTPMLMELYASFRKSLPLNLIDHKWHRYEDELYVEFPAQNALARFFDLGIAALGGVISAERLEIVDSICARLGEVVAELVRLQWMSPPDKETPIRLLGFQLLKAAFPDAEPDGGIRFRLVDGTSRRPDTAIPSLRLCVEFKFANDKAELSQRVDEIVADMSAYGDPRYDLFRAVVFAPYEGVTQESLQTLVRERMKNVHPRCEWQVFPAKGPGGRTKS